MAGEWATASLGELCDFRAGSVFKPAFQRQSSGDYPFVKVSDMNLPANAVRIQAANNWVSEADLRELRARPFPPGTVVFAKIGEALRQNRLRQVGRETIVDNNMMGAVPRSDRIDPRFFYYALSRFDFSDIAQGTALPYLTVSSLSALSLDVPPPDEQRAIAHILGTLDDKIELNRRMSATLEAMARAIFKKGLDQDSKEHRLDDLCEIFDGPHATPRTVAQGPVFLGISNLLDGLLDLSDTRHVTEDDFVRWTKRVTPATGDIVFSYETRLGQAARIPKGLRCCLGRRMGLLRAKKEKISPAILLYAYLSPKFQDTVRSRTIHGSTVDRIPLIEMGGFPVVVPGFDTERRIAPILECLRERIEHDDSESRTLAALRDALLPKLISGELRVEDAETFLDRVL